MNCTQLNEVLNEYEVIIKELSEVLIRELALRDELEYDKELKNQFISLLLTIQKRRRDGNLDKKKKKNKSVNNNMNSPEGPSTVSEVYIWFIDMINIWCVIVNLEINIQMSNEWNLIMSLFDFNFIQGFFLKKALAFVYLKMFTEKQIAVKIIQLKILAEIMVNVMLLKFLTTLCLYCSSWRL